MWHPTIIAMIALICLIILFEVLRIFPLSRTLTANGIAVAIAALAEPLAGVEIGAFIGYDNVPLIAATIALFNMYARWRTDAPLVKAANDAV